MKGLRKLIFGQSGIVLAGSLMILSALIVAGLAARVMLQNDHRTTANLRHGSQAFYLAASGIEWGKSQILSFNGVSPAPLDQSLSFNNGRFSVFFGSAVSVGPLSAHFVVRSLGVLNSDSHALQAGLTKSYDLSDSALGLRGNIQAVNLSGNAIGISGVDHDPTSGQPTGVITDRAAVSTDSPPMSDLLRAQTAGLQAGSLQTDSGDSAVVPSEYLTAATLNQLVSHLCSATGAVTLSIPSSDMVHLANQSWGTRTTPQLRCVEGISGTGDGVVFSGNTQGAGILIVRNAEMILTGTFHWEGLIIVVGNDVSLRAPVSSITTVLGSVLVSETGNPSPGALAVDVQGNFRSLFSRTALNRAAGLIPVNELGTLYGNLPASLKQDYWRTVSP
ncbi:MAG TPA: hypothetical protein VKB53_04405 [Gammaproteobacteria bacterium]|nr:hypothetical protein [Gammaproteobacteria bacterium]